MGSRTKHPTDVQRPHKNEAPILPTRMGTNKDKEVEKPAPKPLTPREKIEAITPRTEPAFRNDIADAPSQELSRGLLYTGSYLSITHRASRAPATQSLELRHGKFSSLLYCFTAILNLARFYDEIFRMLITDLFRMRKHMWIFPLPSF